MKYKNVTEGIIRFRAHNSKGIIEVFELKPDEEMESDREVEFGGLKKVSEQDGKGKSNKKVKGDE